MHEGKKKGMTAWVRKAIAEHAKGKSVTMVYPIDKWVLMLIKAGAKITNLGDVRWLATEDGSVGKGTGRHIACFVLDADAPKHHAQCDGRHMEPGCIVNLGPRTITLPEDEDENAA